MATDPRTHDAVVVGGGHNGLVTAAYLARAGRRVLVLEARHRVGGAAETAELGGVRVPRLADTVGRLRPSVVRDLDLKSHGLRLVAPDIRVFAPQPDGRAITLWSDQARTVDGLPIRRPGAQLVPGGLAPVEEPGVRDPEEIRNNLTRHLSGVRSGRAEAQYNDGGLV